MAQGRRKDKPAAASTASSVSPPGALEGKSSLENWASKPYSAASSRAKELYPKIVKCYENQRNREDTTSEFWDIYNAIPDENLMYSGNNTGYIPTVRNCINARTKRCLKYLFPANHKHVDGINSDGEVPHTQLSLLEHYIRKTRLKDIVRTDLIAGDVTGQWNLYIDWTRSYRRITELARRNPILSEIDYSGERKPEAAFEVEDVFAGDDEIEEEVKTRDVLEEGPDIVDFADEDLAVYPPTVDDIERAEMSCIRLRMDMSRVQELVDSGVFVLPEGTQDAEQLFEQLKKQQSDRGRRNPSKKSSEDAGVRTEGTLDYMLVFEGHTKLKFDNKFREKAVVYYAGPNTILGIIKAPWWGGKTPILSAAVDKRQGSFKGRSKIEPVKYLQWNLVDFWNMGQDSAMYSMLPITMSDPLKNPNWQTMVLGLGAAWACDPNSTKFASFPSLWKDAAQNCDMIQRQIWESMDVNEMMLGRMPAGRKNNQLMGQMQQEQATNIEDHASRYEECMLQPLIERIFEYDQQFRTAKVSIMSKGELGAKAKVESIPPQQWGERYFFQWQGTTFMQNMQRLQLQISAVNVVKGIPPQQLGGKRLDLGPFAEKLMEDAFGPEIAAKILVDERNMFTIDADIENEILFNGMPVDVHEADNDVEHLQKHISLPGPDPTGVRKQHIAMHVQQLMKKRQMQMMQQQQQGGVPGSPGGAGPGAAGAPRPGAVPGQPRPAQQPPGAINQDQMAGAMGRG